MSDQRSIPFYPDLTGVRFVRDDYRPRRNLTRLARDNPEAWRREWRRINVEEPSLAALLKDPDFQALRGKFNAEVLIDVKEKA